jgi:hypothetical protein
VEPRALTCVDAADCGGEAVCEEGRCVPPAEPTPPDVGPRVDAGFEGPLDAGVDAGVDAGPGCVDVEGFIDEDGDGAFVAFAACTVGGVLPDSVVAQAPGALDCDDAHPGRYPDAVEVCDGVDNSCDGSADTDPVCACTPVARPDGGAYLICPWRRAQDAAEKACGDVGLRLAMPKTDADAQVIGAAINVQHWIGLGDAELDGTFEWSDGDPVGALTPEAGQPSDPGVEGCASMRQGGWGDNSCDDRKPYVCEAIPVDEGGCVDGDGDGRGVGCAAGRDCDDGDPGVWGIRMTWVDGDGDELPGALPRRRCVGDGAAPPLPPPSTAAELDCNDGAGDVGAGPCPNSCLVETIETGSVLLCADLTTTADDAALRCDALAARPALLKAALDQNRAKDAALLYTNLIGGTRSFWIGLRAPLTDNVYQWADGDPLVADDFHRNEPNNASEQCVEMRANGGWHDEQCTLANRRFACTR